MATPNISATAFERLFERFKLYIRSHGSEFRDFQSGYMYEEEFYKTRVRDRALQELDFSKWNDSEPGTGKILDRVIAAIEIKGSKLCHNNLVEWESKYGPEKRHHNSLYVHKQGPRTSQYEMLLFDFFTGELPPEEAMPELIELAGRQYDFISYLYFLKDWERFMQCRPQTFQIVFEMLGVTWGAEKPELSGRCSWENYQQFNATLMEVQKLLISAGVPNVRLLDAHSFCWTIGRVKLPELEDQKPGTIRVIEIDEVIAAPGPAENHNGNGTVDFEALAKRRAYIGRLAEERAMDAECSRLTQAGKVDLAAKVRLVSDDHTLGYDLESYEVDGTPRKIEVKATNIDDDNAAFFFTENEWQTSQRELNYWIYLVGNPRDEKCEIRAVKPGFLRAEHLTPVVHRASISFRS